MVFPCAFLPLASLRFSASLLGAALHAARSPRVATVFLCARVKRLPQTSVSIHTGNSLVELTRACARPTTLKCLLSSLIWFERVFVRAGGSKRQPHATNRLFCDPNGMH